MYIDILEKCATFLDHPVYCDRLERSIVDLGVSTYLEEHHQVPGGLPSDAEVEAGGAAWSQVDDYDASSLLSYSHSELSFTSSSLQASRPPWFVRTLPSRLEIVEVSTTNYIN